LAGVRDRNKKPEQNSEPGCVFEWTFTGADAAASILPTLPRLPQVPDAALV
jgi:hypothetical protein